jgi:hypothetical protein
MPDTRTCGKCGSARTQVVGQSVALVGAFVQCLDCGHLTLASSPKPVTADVDKRRIERLVHAVIDEFALPFELLMVSGAPAGWQITVKTRTGGIERFEVKADALSAMRAAVTRALPFERS